MLHWLSDIGHFITGSISVVKDWLIRIIQSVYSFLDATLRHLESELVTSWNELNGFIGAVERFARSAYDALTIYVRVMWKETLSWVTSALDDIRTYLDRTVSWITHEITRLSAETLALIDDLKTWIVKNIIDPLISDVSAILNWLETYGSLVTTFLTHPDILAAWLARYLWRSYFELIRKYSVPIGRWIIHSMIGVAGDVADVLETIMTSLL